MLDVYQNYAPRAMVSSSDDATENDSDSKSDVEEDNICKEEEEEKFLEEQRKISKSRKGPLTDISEESSPSQQSELSLS